MVDTSKTTEQVSHVEEGIRQPQAQAVPDVARVEGGVLADAGAKNEHHLQVAKDGHVSEPRRRPALHCILFHSFQIATSILFGTYGCSSPRADLVLPRPSSSLSQLTTPRTLFDGPGPRSMASSSPLRTALSSPTASRVNARR